MHIPLHWFAATILVDLVHVYNNTFFHSRKGQNRRASRNPSESKCMASTER